MLVQILHLFLRRKTHVNNRAKYVLCMYIKYPLTEMQKAMAITSPQLKDIAEVQIRITINLHTLNRDENTQQQAATEEH